MIARLSESYSSSSDLIIIYDQRQEELYKEAISELREENLSLGYKHHSPEIERNRDKKQTKYRQEKGLLLDLFSCCNNSKYSNVAAMIVKHFFKKKGFNVLVSSEDFSLIFDRNAFDRNTGYPTKGLNVIKEIFGRDKVEEVMGETSKKNGGEPDLFVYLDHDPNNACFVEVKRKNERLTEKQKMNFPIIERLLCPIEIARIVPSE